MSNDFDLDDWGDDIFSGDLNFDSDFDGKKQGFLSSVASGFLGGLKDNTFGSTEGRIKMARMALPRSYGRVFDYGRELNAKKRDIISELKSSSFTAVTELQDLGKNVLDRFQDKVPNRIAERIAGFAEQDFSDWEKRDYSSSGVATATMEETNDDEVQVLTLTAMSQQLIETKNLGRVFSKTMNEIGGRQLGQLGVGNQLLGSIDTTLQGLLSYQRKIQIKNDAAKINLLSRIHLTNAKYYKFMEAAMHRSIDELKGINKNSAMSDYQKTSNFQALKGSLRQNMITKLSSVGGVGNWARGLLGQGKNSLEALGGVAGDINTAMQMTEGLGGQFNIGQMVGQHLSGMLIDQLPRMANTKQAKDLVSRLSRQFPAQAKQFNNLYRKLDRAGSIASFNIGNAAGIINSGIANNWEYQADTTSYEDYVAALPPGKKPVPRSVYKLYQSGKNFAGNRLNDVSWQINRSNGMQYDLSTRNLKDLDGNALWTTQSDRTLNETIPAWFSKIHQTLEMIRTGSDDVSASRYDYQSGRIISANATKDRINKTLFGNQQLDGFASYASDMAKQIDADGQLSPGAQRALAYQLGQTANRKEAFNPFNFLNLHGQDGTSNKHADEIQKLMTRRFSLTPEEIAKNEENPFAILRGLSDTDAQNRLIDVSEGVKRMQEYAPDISRQIDLLRNAGMDDLLRQMGLITTDKGQDRFNMDSYWKSFGDRLDGKKAPAPDVLDETRLPTRGFGGGSPAPQPTPTMDFSKFDELNKSILGLTDTLGAHGQTGAVDNSSSFSEMIQRLDKGNGFLETLIKLTEDQTATIGNLKLKPTTGSSGEGDEELTEEDKRKRKFERGSILERLKGMGGTVGGLLKGGLDKVMSNEPLMLGGFLGGIAGLVSHDPKIALLAGAGTAAWMWYKNQSEAASADEASDDQDLYSEDSPEPILESRKLKAGQYYDNVKKAVIKSWKEIKGSVTDLVTKVVVSAQTLGGKLFGSDGRRVIISGLNKAKDAVSSVFKLLDPLTRIRRMGRGVGDMLYQMDVFKAGEKSATLTRAGFKAGKYFKEVNGAMVAIHGWKDIDGPVFDENGDTLITQTDFDNGLVTSGGMKVNSLTNGLQKLGKSALGKVTGLGARMGPMADKAKALISKDYTPITDRLDHIYSALCEGLGITPKMALSTGSSSITPSGKLKTPGEIAAAKVAEEELGSSDPGDSLSGKIRTNSLADQARKKKEALHSKYESAMVRIADKLDGEKANTDDKKKKDKPEEENSGILSRLVGFMKNPFGITSGFQTLFKMAKGFFTVGAAVLPLIAKGVMKTVSLLTKMVMGGGRLADLATGGRGRRARRGAGGGKLSKLGKLGKFAKGAGLAAVGTLGIDAAMDYFDVDEDSATGQVLNAGSTALNIAGGVQMAGSVAGMMGFNASLGGVASAIGSGATAMAPLIFNPITLTVGAVAGVGYLVYKHYSKGKGEQFRLRMAQYGIKDIDSDFAMKVRAIEDQLKDYVLLRNGQAAFAATTPLEKIFTGIAPDPSDQVATKNFYTWFNLRFKPIYLSYAAGLDTAGFKSYEDFDKSTEPRILSICSDVNNAIGTIVPYPYDISEPFDPGTPLIARDETKRIILECFDALKTYNKRHGRTEGGLLKDGLAVVETEAERVKRSDNAGFLERMKMKLDGTYESSDDLREINSKYPVQKSVADINISDLMPSGDKPLDFVTAFRLAAYGNMDNVPWRVEAVLKMERYCEDYIQLIGNDVRFTSKTGIIFNLFKNTFRLEDKDAGNWLLWFRDRFLPVCMAWVKFCLLNRKQKPKDGWMTMSMTSRYNFAKELVQLKTITQDSVKSTWDVWQSPFGKGTQSTAFNERAKAFLQNLQTMATDASLKDPVGEANRTSAAAAVSKDQLHSLGNNGVNKTVATGNAANDMLAPSLQAAAMAPLGGSTDTSMIDLSRVRTDGGGAAYTGGKLTANNDKGMTVPKNAAIQLIMKNMLAAGFNDKRMVAGMLANLDYESGGFRHTAENMNYSAANLMRVFGKRIGSMANAEALSKQGPQAIANAVYGNRLGNTGPNDGWLYRGRGFIQLTGKENYANASKDLGIDLVNHPELVSNDPNVAAKTAVWFLKTHKRLQSLPQSGFDYATAAINPALIGIQDRRSLYNQYLTQLANGQLTVEGKPDGAKDTDAAAPAQGTSESPSTVGASPSGQVPSKPIPESNSVGGSNATTPAVSPASASATPSATPAVTPAVTPQPAAPVTPVPAVTPKVVPQPQQAEATPTPQGIHPDAFNKLLQGQDTQNALLKGVLEANQSLLQHTKQSSKSDNRTVSTT